MRRLVFDQSSPVHPISESRGGSTSVTKSEVRKTEFLVSNIGYQSQYNQYVLEALQTVVFNYVSFFYINWQGDTHTDHLGGLYIYILYIVWS